ncbi:ComEA family DNA-binding protein [Xylanimonas oleitrophica]|uniref:ComEA family DNA-binding protein n=2 Tax=Xylanimonas oleitrophica TaxID=2607479 RepID=A0A2W5WQR8_9MICO|nr:ComEA family DNA-binding protein [Xylanimonas oleitrophica]
MEDEPVPTPEPGPSPTPPEAAPADLVVVHVVGQVITPGLVTLPAGARVADAVDAAGGPSADADLGALNLARAVVDGEQLRIPAPGEEVVEPQLPAPGGATGTPAGAPAGHAGGLVDLNTADEAALQTLPGIGPALAGRIVAWRQENGGFASVDELDEVSGIGPAVLAKLRDLVRV